jgi:hypothetical protein
MKKDCHWGADWVLTVLTDGVSAPVFAQFSALGLLTPE